MWFTSNNNIELKMYEDFPFSDKHTVVSTYEEADVITLLKGEVNIPDGSMVKINYMQAKKFFTIDGELDGGASFTSGEVTLNIDYSVNYTLIGPTFTVSNTDRIEDLPTKLRDIKLSRLI